MTYFKMKLRDGEVATVRIEVCFEGLGDAFLRRAADLENYLGGGLAGFAGQLVIGQAIEGHTSDIRFPGVTQ